MTDEGRIQVESSSSEKGSIANLTLKILNFNYTTTMNSSNSSSFQTIAKPLCTNVRCHLSILKIKPFVCIFYTVEKSIHNKIFIVEIIALLQYREIQV